MNYEINFSQEVASKLKSAPVIPETNAGTAWQDYANCNGEDPELFFAESGLALRMAKTICSACTVKSECLNDALVNYEPYGTWGGLIERERRRLKRRWTA